MPVDLQITLGNITLQNPVLVAAGTLGYGLEFQRALRLDQLGGVIIKTITRQPKAGNPPPRLVETPSGMLNSVGLQNVGLEAFLAQKLPELAHLAVPVIVSILDETPEGLAEMVGRLDQAQGVAAIELNLSCPNVHDRSGLHLMVSQDPAATEAMVKAARACTRKPLIAKLSPDVTDPRPIAQAAERAGADMLALTNTFTGMSLDPRTRRSRLGSMTGGLSGPAIRPLSVYRVWLVHQVVRCPLIGLGGIVQAEDAIEFFLAGASAVAIGTANFADPRAPVKILKDLTRLLERQGVNSLQALVGAVEPHASRP